MILHLEDSGFKWNDVYIATTTPGEAYSGTLAGADGTNFFFRDDQDRVLVGKLKDLIKPAESGARINFTAS